MIQSSYRQASHTSQCLTTVSKVKASGQSRVLLCMLIMCVVVRTVAGGRDGMLLVESFRCSKSCIITGPKLCEDNRTGKKLRRIRPPPAAAAAGNRTGLKTGRFLSAS